MDEIGRCTATAVNVWSCCARTTGVGTCRDHTGAARLVSGHAGSDRACYSFAPFCQCGVRARIRGEGHVAIAPQARGYVTQTELRRRAAGPQMTSCVTRSSVGSCVSGCWSMLVLERTLYAQLHTASSLYYRAYRGTLPLLSSGRRAIENYLQECPSLSYESASGVC